MDFYVTSHLSKQALRHDIKASDSDESKAIARILSRLGEYDARKLFLEDGYPSMRAYCMGELNYREEKASKRIYAARTARKFPVLFIALADGRLRLSGVVMLARHLTLGNVGELVEAASHKTNEEMALLIAERFPRPDLPERLVHFTPPPVSAKCPEHSVRNAQALFAAAPCPGLVPENALRNAVPAPPALDPLEHSPGNPAVVAPRGRMTPLSPQKYGFEFTGDDVTHDEYEKFRERMRDEIPSGEMALVMTAALKLANAALDKKQFAATDRPGPSRGGADPRCIPAEVKRAVAARDEGKCAFVSESGRRCGSRSMLEYDHIEPVARGGASTLENLRLLCRAHNQHEAERSFGADFMNRKREARGHGSPSHMSNAKDAATGEPL